MVNQPKAAETIFADAINIPSPAERQQFLMEACDGDAELLRDVEKLVEDHFRAGDFLEAPVVAAGITEIRPVTEQPGDTIGRYKLLQQIGEGGFGVVYMAEQTAPVRRKVALKIIKPGMDTKNVIARFEAERQALALMDHPNIAKVLDAGTTETGRPYFVMELVKGIPITQFCDENGLSTSKRLDLFVTVCRAIQHAHQKGIIHRDLKPSNVMVTLHDNQPVPKVIDFGVSKAITQQLTERTLFTAYGQMIGTPVYMSPEQAQMSGLDVDTRSDVYSLGVLLYELLTGSTPLDAERLRKSGFAEIQRLIREEEVPRPSLRLSTNSVEAVAQIAKDRGTDSKHLTTEIRGDLDWIVMKALEKDRNRRYDTAVSFAEDVLRFINHETVEACPPSTGYRLRKYLRRNRSFLVVAGTIGLVLIIATAVSTVMAIQATKARNDAKNQEQIALGALENADTEREKAEAESRRADRARLESDIAKYAYQIRLADSNFSRVNGAEALEILESTDPKLRGWEYGRLKAIWNARRGMFDEDREYKYVAISPDGELVAGGGDSGEVRLFDFLTRQPAGVLKIGGTRVTSLAFSADGKYLAASSESSAHLWEVESRRVVGEITFPPPLEIQTEEEKRIPPDVTLSRGIRVFEFKTSPGQVPRIAFDPRGEKIAVVVQDNIQIWNGTLTEKLLDIPVREEDENYAFVIALAFHPQQSQLLVKRYSRVPDPGVSYPEGRAAKDFRLLDAETGDTIVKSVPAEAGNLFFQRESLQIENSGRWFASGTGIHDLKTCAFLRKIPTGTAFTEFVALCDDRMQAAITHSYHDGVTIVDIASGILAHRLAPFRKLTRGVPMGNYVSCVAISANGKRIVSGLSEPRIPDTNFETERQFAYGLIGWNLDDSVTVKRLKESAARDDTAENGNAVRTSFRGHMFPPETDWFARVVQKNRNDQQTAGAQQVEEATPHPTTSYVEFLSLETGETLFTLAEPNRRLVNAAFSKNGRQMVCSTGEEIEIWNVPERRLINTLGGPVGHVREILVDPSGRYLAVLVYDSDESNLPPPPLLMSPPPIEGPQEVAPTEWFYEFFLWDLNTGKLISSEKASAPEHEPLDNIRLLAFHPSGNRLIRSRQMYAYADGSDILKSTTVMEVMETSSGKTLRRDEVPCTVGRACFARGGDKLYYAGTYDRAQPGQRQGIWMWDLETDRRTRLYSQPVSSLAISPDESRLLFLSGVHGTVNRSLVLFETETHQKVFEMPVERNANGYAFTADGGIVRYFNNQPVERLLVEQPSED